MMLWWWLIPTAVVMFGVAAWFRSPTVFATALAALVVSIVDASGRAAPPTFLSFVMPDDPEVISWTTDGERWIWVWVSAENGPRALTLPYSEKRRRQYERAEAQAEEQRIKLRIRRPEGWSPDEEDLTMYPMPVPALPQKQGG